MKSVLLATLTLFVLAAFAPAGLSATAGGATVVADTFDSNSENGQGDGTVVRDGDGGLSCTPTSGSGSAWKREDANSPYKKQNPAEGEEKLEVTFVVTETDAEGNPTGYSWTLMDGDTFVDSGTLKAQS